MQKQLEHNQIKFEKHKFPLALILDNIFDAKNVGSFFRLADALGVEALHLCGNTPQPPHKAIRKTARGTDSFVPYFVHNTSQNCIKELKHNGYCVVALEITDKSLALADFTFAAHKKIALVAGNEEQGIQQAVLQEVEHAVHIPMFGINSSMNVAVAAAIATNEITRQLARR